MQIEIKQIIDTVSAAAEDVKELRKRQETEIKQLNEKFELLDNALAKTQVEGKRFYPGELNSNKSDPMLVGYLQKGIVPAETKDISVTADGQGITVRSQWTDRIYQQIRETSPVRSVATTLTTDSNALEVLIDRGEPDSDWIGELDPRDPTTASFVERHKIPVFEHYARPEATQQILEDSQLNVENWLASKIQSRFTRQENLCFMLGDGVDKPRGILTYTIVPDDTFTWGAVPASYSLGAQYTGVAGDITNPDCLIDMVDSLKSSYLQGASWMMTRAFLSKVRKLKDQENRYLFEPSLQAGSPGRLLGYPIILAEDFPELAEDEPAAIFGNFAEGYTVVDRIGLQVVRDNITKPGWIRWYARKRVGGAVTNPEALKVLIAGVKPA